MAPGCAHALDRGVPREWCIRRFLIHQAGQASENNWTSDHFFPFQCRISFRMPLVRLSRTPTAQQLPDDTQRTANSSLMSPVAVPAGWGF